MRILIVSDTHGRHTGLERAIEEVGPLDFLVHLGDVAGEEHMIESLCHCPAYIIGGNNDYFSALPREMEIQFGTKKAFMTHGHAYGVSMGVERLVAAGKAKGADYVMFGHTHRPFLEKISGITVLNPGSIALPRQKDRRGSYILMESDESGEFTFEIRYI